MSQSPACERLPAPQHPTHVFEWVHSHGSVVGWLAAASAAMFVGTLAVIPLLIARLPHDYFLRSRADLLRSSAHPLLRVTFWIVKNVLGAMLLVLGVAMLVLPGQGLLTILLGLVLLDFPGKRGLERRLVRRRRILATLNWLRRRAGRPPLEVDPS